MERRFKFQVFGEWNEISVGKKERDFIFDAKGSNNDVRGFSDCDSLFSQKSIVVRAFING